MAFGLESEETSVYSKNRNSSGGNMKLVKAIGGLLAMVLTISAAACNGGTRNEEKSELPLTSAYGIGDQDLLYGMCYLLEERDYDGDYDMAAEVEVMKNLGVKTVRQWMHFTNLMTDKETLKEDECEEMHELLRLCSEAGMINIGMNHHNFNGGTSSTGKPKRVILPGSDYVKWLDNYYTSWHTLASEFPEVKYWEIDNEVNNPDFMHGIYGERDYTVQEMADIAADMFYYASRAIHDANPSATTIMGSMTEPQGLGKGNLLEFYQTLYDNIASGEFGYFYYEEDKLNASTDADDYFEIACWHPYYWDEFDAEDFVAKNNLIYDILLKNEGKHKKVYLTEIGFNDLGRGEVRCARELEEMYRAVEEKMPYVETVNYFKMFDDGRKDAWGGNGDYIRYGLFYDPDPDRIYVKLDETTHRTPESGGETAPNGAAKNKAYKFQELAGGSGDIELLAKGGRS